MVNETTPPFPKSLYICKLTPLLAEREYVMFQAAVEERK
jgi:hypothetical protein